MIVQINKVIFSNTFYQMAGKMVTSFLGFVCAALLARHLGVLGFGQYNLIYNFLGIFGIFSDFGLATLLIKEVAAKKADSKEIAGIFSLRIILSFAFWGISYLVLGFFPYSQEVKIGVFVALAGHLFLGLSSIYWAIEQGQLNFLRVVLIQVFSSFLTTILVILGTKSSAGLLFFVFAGVAGAVAGFWVSFCLGIKKMVLLNLKVYKIIILKVWPIGLWAVVSTIYLKLDMVILSLFYPPDRFPDVGYYSAAFKYFEVMGVLFGFFQMTSYPVIASSLNENNFLKVFSKITKISYLLTIFGSFLLFVLVNPLILILGRNFVPAANSLRILSLAVGFSVLSGPWVSLAIAAEKQKKVLLNSFFALLISFSGNLIAIPRLSFIGASWIVVLTQAFVALANWRIGKKIIGDEK